MKKNDWIYLANAMWEYSENTKVNQSPSKTTDTRLNTTIWR